MAEKNWHADSTILIAVQAVVCLIGTVAPARAFALSDSFAPPSSLDNLDPNLIWEALIGASSSVRSWWQSRCGSTPRCAGPGGCSCGATPSSPPP
ncbi:hypothetical protein NK6_5139 [Bradyrhizobium diazoefficiens]|uniref:Uncharacterized protein n=1 Tax=Bradyrhizobium diazoefficiens TaxID=1355477 RepID=A0A0E4BRG5_9BRAD|nr:hypothetical protein NK6_5139 [Bradyrhizobium diazoefficiens]